MIVDDNRRYTDREVGLVLKRAAELEERQHRDVGGRGLTLRELQEIGREVGLSSDILNRAVAELQRGGAAPSISLLGPPSSAKAVRAVRGELPQAALSKLVQVVEERVNATGTVTEALGAVRWTSVPDGNRFSTTQVVFTPSGAETQIQVTHRFATKLRALVNLLPAAWGGMAGVAVSAGLAAGVLGSVSVVGAGAVVGGVGGRVVWHFLTGRADARVNNLVNEIATSADDLAGQEIA